MNYRFEGETNIEGVVVHLEQEANCRVRLVVASHEHSAKAWGVDVPRIESAFITYDGGIMGLSLLEQALKNQHISYTYVNWPHSGKLQGEDVEVTSLSVLSGPCKGTTHREKIYEERAMEFGKIVAHRFAYRSSTPVLPSYVHLSRPV